MKNKESIDAKRKKYKQVLRALDKPFLNGAKVMKILEISKPALLWWDKKELKLSKRKGQFRSWRRYSVIDCLCFSVMKNLEQLGYIGLSVRITKDFTEFLKVGFFLFPDNFRSFCHGHCIIVVVIANELSMFRESDRKLIEGIKISKINEPRIILPLHVPFRNVLKYFQKGFIKGFHIEYGVQGKKPYPPLIFVINGERIEL